MIPDFVKQVAFGTGLTWLLFGFTGGMIFMVAFSLGNTKVISYILDYLNQALRPPVEGKQANLQNNK